MKYLVLTIFLVALVLEFDWLLGDDSMILLPLRRWLRDRL